MDKDYNYRYNANLFAIEPNTNEVPLEENAEELSVAHDSYKVYNVGRVEVSVELLKGICQWWESVVEKCSLKPGHTIMFDNVGQFFIVSAVRIINNTDTRAIVHCTQASGYSEITASKEDRQLEDLSYNKKLRETFSVGVKNVAYTTRKYEGLLESFFPPGEANVWENILLKLKPLIKEDELQPLATEICSYMANFREKLNMIANGLSEKTITREMYNEVEEELQEFYKKITNEFHSNYKGIEMLLLPLLSNFVLMKVTFYTIGIVTASDVDFSAADVARLENHVKATVNDATKYINNLLTKQLDNTYNTSRPEDLFNNMMNIRSYIGIHGLEFSFIWKDMLRSPYLSSNLSSSVITYSNFFGRPTPNLIREGTSSKMYPPLTPVYMGFIYNYLTSIEVYLWPQSSRKIGGMKLTFADHTSHIMGTKTDKVGYIDMKNAYIVKLQVTGRGSVDSCTFFMNDGRKLSFGTKEENCEEEIFELLGHRIVSIFLSSDSAALGGQAANIAVSYRLNSEWEQ